MSRLELTSAGQVVPSTTSDEMFEGELEPTVLCSDDMREASQTQRLLIDAAIPRTLIKSGSLCCPSQKRAADTYIRDVVHDYRPSS